MGRREGEMSGELKLLPLTEEERTALQIAIVLVIQSINVMDHKDPVVKKLIESQLAPLHKVKEKLET